MSPISALSALLALTLSADLAAAHGPNGHNHFHKRQSTAPADAGATPAPTGAAAPPAGDIPRTGPYSVPPLSLLNSALPEGPTPAFTNTYAPGAKPTFASAPALPEKFVFTPGAWPELDKIPPTNSPEVQEWLKELEGHDIPDIKPTVDGSCGGDPVAAAEAEQRAWWTCGGWTAGNDIVVCPDKNTWGVSFDDGPTPHTPRLLQYLDDKDLTATFFVVGSRVISYPDILVAEHMAGHEISIHTWSHHALTTLTNEEIVAELGWTRKAIQTVLGVTPKTMRAPYGDIDNRVRAIANAMGLRPIIWTTGPNGPFDTNDWHIPGGTSTGEDTVKVFEGILGQAANMDTGFIVLAHDLYEVTVDLAVGYMLDTALAHQPPFKLESIGRCLNIDLNNLYAESATIDITQDGSNSGSNSSTGNGSSNPGSDTGSSGSNSTGAADQGGNGAASLSMSAFAGVVAAAVAAAFAGTL